MLDTTNSNWLQRTWRCMGMGEPLSQEGGASLKIYLRKVKTQ